MGFGELKQLIRKAAKGSVDAEILVNEGGIYLIQIVSYGRSYLLTQAKGKSKGDYNRPLVFKSLSECYDQLKIAGIRQAFVVQSFAHCEIITQQDNFLSHTDRRLVQF